MKKNSKKTGSKKPGKPQKKVSQADRVQRIFNPNARGLAIRHQNQALQIGAKAVTQLTAPRSARREFRELKKGGKPGTEKLMAWAALVSDPFVGVNGVKCPLNFNPAPSLLSFRATLVDSTNSLKVTATYARQMFIFPGHNVMATPAVGVGAALTGGTGLAYLSDMDEVAYHARFQTIAGVNYVPGPMDSPGGALATRTAISHHLSADSGVGMGGVIVDSIGGAHGTWDNPLPLVADPTKAGHSRWKMIAMGVRIRNTTPVGSRGGNIVSVQPANVVRMSDYSLQTQFDRDPSFKIWGDGTDEVEISWTPRTRDLAYWHQSTATNITLGTDTASTSLEGGAIIVWFNAATATDQYYSYEIYAHFELSGNYVQVFSGQTHSMSVPVAPVQQALGAHVNNSPTAAGIGHTIAQAVGGAVSSAERQAVSSMHEAAKMGFQAAVSAVKASI